ncbi:MAG: radical SAM protein [Bacteroidales bacterium]|nr:radical SAM protein [Candidatus Liminaster caballi]
MKINEIFYSLQGEGFYAGTPSVFVRFSGCNLKCDFCDTQHQAGVEMTEREVADAVMRYPARHVVLTGGEPSLQLTSSLVAMLHEAGRFVAIETNGTHPLPEAVDWITCSPKYKPVVISRCDELKVVYEGQDMAQYSHIPATHHFLQPCDRQDPERNAANVRQVVDYCLAHPDWRISIQLHKVLNIR